MIQHTLEKLESGVRQADSLSGKGRKELLDLVEQLKTEVGALATTDADAAQSVADFAAVSTREAIRRKPDPKLVTLSREGLSHSVSEFEGSHPRLVQVVNSVCNTLSNLGI